ncbi:hypothetical protein [Actinokineospora pegani]|uniref:hypothetical protein n=1 Tax=Actinokineospora pegani TaxID=2654637 RepID=UPI0012EAF504|nr:hypothetical protein [Actinokineospora pegani]
MSEQPVERDTEGRLLDKSQHTIDEAKELAERALGDHAEPDPVPDSDPPASPGVPA